MKTTQLRTNYLLSILACTAFIGFGSPAKLAAAEDESAAIVAQLDQEASAPEGGARVEGRLATTFGPLAGSPENAQKLVRGLRDGTSIALTSTVNGQPMTTMIAPPTGKLGYGNTAIAMSLAQENLIKAGIPNPTPTQLQAALMGGSVTNAAGQATSLTGVLALRASGQGWGQIAQASGVRLGSVVSRINAGERGRGGDNKSARGDAASEARGNNGRAATPDTSTLNRGNSAAGGSNAGGVGRGVGGGNPGGVGGGAGAGAAGGGGRGR